MDLHPAETGVIAWKDVKADRVRHFVNYPPDELALSLHQELKPGSKILDIGCGAGRHLRFFSEKGHAPVGIDPSPGQREAAQESLPNIAIHPLEIGKRFPFADNYFDGALSTYAIYHGKSQDIFSVIEETVRVLKGGAPFFFHLISVRDFKYGVGPEVEKSTFKEVRAGESGEIHHFFDLKEVLKVSKLFAKAKIKHVEEPLDPPPGALTEDAFSQLCAHWIIKGVK